MRVMQHNGCGSFVHLTRFDADKTVFDVVVTPDAVLSCCFVQRLDKGEPFDLFVVKCGRNAMLKRNFDVRWFGKFNAIRINCPSIYIFRWLSPWVFQDTALDATTP